MAIFAILLRQVETFFATPDHFNYPLAYYIGLQLCCTLDKDSRLKTVFNLTSPLLKEAHAPDWFIAFEDNQKYELRYFEGRAKYKLQMSLPIFFDQTQRPEPDHQYYPVKHIAWSQGVFVYQRIR